MVAPARYAHVSLLSPAPARHPFLSVLPCRGVPRPVVIALVRHCVAFLSSVGVGTQRLSVRAKADGKSTRAATAANHNQESRRTLRW